MAADGEALACEPSNRLEMTFLARWSGLKKVSKKAEGFRNGIFWIVSGL